MGINKNDATSFEEMASEQNEAQVAETTETAPVVETETENNTEAPKAE